MRDSESAYGADETGSASRAPWGREAVFPTVSVIVPTLNEEKNLHHVLPRIPAWVHEVIVVDGHSTDRTVEVAERLWPGVQIVYQTGKGKGNALTTGFAAAKGEIIVTIDADGSTDPAEIPAFVGALMSGADFAKGSRFMQGGGTVDMELHRRLGNWGLRLSAKALFGGRFSDLCYGYNAFWSRAVDVMQPDGDGFEIETLLSLRALKANLKIAEVASFEYRRIHGVSNLRAISDGMRVLRTIFKERFTRLPVIDLDAIGSERVIDLSEFDTPRRIDLTELEAEEDLGSRGGRIR